MPLDRKRSSASIDDIIPQPKRRCSSSTTRKSGEEIFSSKRCKSWFFEYTTADGSDVIGPEGMEKFCEDIGVEPENVLMLCIAWKLKAEQMCFFTLNEWLRGMADLQCDSVDKLIQKLDELRSLLSDPTSFKNIYRFAYDFAKERSVRSLDTEAAMSMLALLLGKRWPLFPHFKQFVKQHPKYKVINRDQWYNILEFTRLILPDLSNYDEDGAWPVMLDEFVEWFRRLDALSPTATPCRLAANTI